MISHPGVSEEERISLYKLAIAHQDIAEALYTTRLFLRTVKSIKDEGFLHLQDNIISAYSRAFKSNRPYGRPLDSTWPGYTNLRYQTLHYQIIAHRDQTVAHSDSMYRRVEIVPPGVTNMPGYPPTKGLGIQVTNSKFEISSFPIIEQMCLDLGERLFHKMYAELERMYGSMELPSHPFDLLG